MEVAIYQWAAYCEIEGEKITLTGLYGDGEGKKIVVQSQVGL